MQMKGNKMNMQKHRRNLLFLAFGIIAAVILLVVGTAEAFIL